LISIRFFLFLFSKKRNINSRTDRRTVAEREAEEKHQLQLEIEKKRIADQRKMQTQKVQKKNKNSLNLKFDLFF